jgi:hypothetical protein
MADEGEKTKKSKTLGSISIAKLVKDPKSGWTAFEAKSEAFKKAKAELGAAKTKVRDYIKKTAKLPEDYVIDFVKTSDEEVQVVQNLVPTKREKSSSLNELF